jgi:pimeloyl-ACP methyl ester carboxylesterase
VEPYTRLVQAISHVVLGPSAVCQFAYDWRLSVTHNAGELARVAQEHLAAWRVGPGGPDAQLVLVAHSMGGLLCQELGGISGALDGVRAVITLGTPFDGAAKAALILAAGHGGPIPLPARRLQEVAVTMPGVYDLLPAYRCVDELDTARLLTAADVQDLGGDLDLATTALNAQRRRRSWAIPHHHALRGVEQPTVSSLTLTDGVVTGQWHTFTVEEDGDLERELNGRLIRMPGRGDGTVPRNSGRPPAAIPAMPLAQQHATLAHSDEAITFVREILVHGKADTRPPLGEGDVGILLPDVVAARAEWQVELTGIDPLDATVRVNNADQAAGTGAPVVDTLAQRRDGRVYADLAAPEPGLYRVVVRGGSTPVTQFVLAVPESAG